LKAAPDALLRLSRGEQLFENSNMLLPREVVEVMEEDLGEEACCCCCCCRVLW